MWACVCVCVRVCVCLPEVAIEDDELSREVCVGVQLKSLIKVLVGSRLQYQGRR